MSFATWDPSRKGSGVTLSGGNLTAAISGLFMVAASNPVVISGATGYYAEFSVSSSTSFIGFGPIISTGNTSSYLGSAAGEFAMWADGTHDTVSGVNQVGSLYDYHHDLGTNFVVKIAVKSNKLYLGIVGLGWFNGSANNFTGDPAAGTGAVLDSFTAGSWSLGVSCVSGETSNCAANFGASAWADTPPSGFVGWPGASSGTEVNLTGSSSTGSAGSFSLSTQRALSGSSSAGSVGTLAAKCATFLAGIAASGAVGSLLPQTSPALSGSQSTASIGQLAPAIAAALSGSSSVVSGGSFSLSIRVPLSGSESIGETGALSPPGSVTVNLSGEESVGTAGSFNVFSSVPLSGVAASGSAGSLSPSISLTLSGSSSSSAAGSLSPSIAQALTGIVATGSAGSFGVRVVSALHGSESLGTAGNFVFASISPKLVSITIENVGSACSLTVVNVGSKAFTTVTDLD